MIALSLVLAALTGLQYNLFLDIEAERFASQAELVAAAEASDRYLMIAAIAYIAAAGVTGLAALMWIYRAARNCRALGAVDMEVRPGWAVGWNFVPIANLWMPYKAMKEIWFASHDPGLWIYGPAPRVFTLWWTCWILDFASGPVIDHLWDTAKTIGDFKQAALVSIAVLPVSIAASWSLLLIVRRITKVQREMEHQREVSSVF